MQLDQRDLLGVLEAAPWGSRHLNRRGVHSEGAKSIL
jgi:hypothetical protein